MLTLLLFIARAFISGGFQAAYVYTPEVGGGSGSSRGGQGGSCAPEAPSRGSSEWDLSVGQSE